MRSGRRMYTTKDLVWCLSVLEMAKDIIVKFEIDKIAITVHIECQGQGLIAIDSSSTKNALGVWHEAEEARIWYGACMMQGRNLPICAPSAYPKP